MPSVLWSPSASVSGLRRISCGIASLSQQRQLGFQQRRREDVAQVEQRAALLLRFGPDLVADRTPLRGRSRTQLNVDLLRLRGLAGRVGKQTGTRAERAGDRGLD